MVSGFIYMLLLMEKRKFRFIGILKAKKRHGDENTVNGRANRTADSPTPPAEITPWSADFKGIWNGTVGENSDL